ncbi:GerMN domain-containing protein [Nonomuraea sp. SBT364]|uniref:GerMN domain-containing protein n=1 Tax=Nonomuraea sp. SBT364 TaxID=1580530 RepID=UPI00066E6648|nr:GerMN domain-containing protein [Nonomuraea sp. SBT364]
MATVLALAPVQAGTDVKVYFSHGFGIPGKVVAVHRTSPHAGLARFAVEQLIKGPTAAERRRGLHAELGGQIRGRSDCGADFTLKIKKGTATLRFCRTVLGTGVGGDARVLRTIEATLKQFGSVKKVVTLDRKGRCLFDQTEAGTSCRTGHE